MQLTMQFKKMAVIPGARLLCSLQGMEWSVNMEELTLNRQIKCLSLAMGRKANYMGTGVRGLEIWDWESGEILFKILLFLVVDKSENEDVYEKV